MSDYRHINKEILRLAVPSILANITVPLVGIVDTAIVGHLSDAVAIGGIAIGTMLFDLLYWNFGFLRVGTAGLTAQAWGKNNTAPKETATTSAENTSQILLQSLSMALIGAAFIWLIQWLFVTVVLALVPCSPEVASFARSYFNIRIWAAPATLLLMSLRGWFIGMQNTMATMITDLTINGVNILASWILAVYTPLGTMGVAWGTLIAQYVGLITAAAILLYKYRLHITKQMTRAALHWRNLKRMFVLNGNLFIRSLCFMVIYVGFTSLAAKYGDDELAVSSIMMKLFMLFSYFIDGFAYAGEALTGRFIGERNGKSLIDSVRVLFVWTIVIGVICTILYAAEGEGMIRLMTSDVSVIDDSRRYLIWLILMPLISCLAFMWDGIYIGATAGSRLRNSMIWAAVGFVLTYLLLEHLLGIQALYVAYFVHLAIRAIYMTVCWRRVKPVF